MKLFVVIVHIILWLTKTNLILCDKVDICGPNSNRSAWDQMRVKQAFHNKEHVGLYVELKRGSGSPQTANTAIRTHYWVRPDPSAGTKHNYFETAYWPQLSDIVNRSHNLKFTFDVNGLENTFKTSSGDPLNQKSSTLQYFVSSTNFTVAVEFDELEKRNERSVYQETTDEDDSEMLNLKLLYHHFPYGVQIKDILIFSRQKYFTTKEKPFYYAFVYTSEKSLANGRDLYVRHYLIAEEKLYSNSHNYKRLIWGFDQSNQICSQLNKLPDAVVLLHTETANVGANTEINGQIEPYPAGRTTHTFAEFYGDAHKLVTVNLTRKTETFTLNINDTMIPNAESILYCGRHPEKDPIAKAKCLDYNNMDTEYEAASQDQLSSTWTFFLLLIAIIASVICILSLIAIGVYLLVVPEDSKAQAIPSKDAQKANTSNSGAQAMATTASGAQAVTPTDSGGQTVTAADSGGQAVTRIGSEPSDSPTDSNVEVMADKDPGGQEITPKESDAQQMIPKDSVV